MGVGVPAFAGLYGAGVLGEGEGTLPWARQCIARLKRKHLKGGYGCVVFCLLLRSIGGSLPERDVRVSFPVVYV